MRILSLNEVKLWLLENEDYYNELQPILKLRCSHCLDNQKYIPCIRETYKEKFAFEELYVRTGVLPKYLETVREIDEVIEAYKDTNLDDKAEFQNWITYLENFWEERYLCGEIEEMHL